MSELCQEVEVEVPRTEENSRNGTRNFHSSRSQGSICQIPSPGARVGAKDAETRGKYPKASRGRHGERGGHLGL